MSLKMDLMQTNTKWIASSVTRKQSDFYRLKICESLSILYHAFIIDPYELSNQILFWQNVARKFKYWNSFLLRRNSKQLTVNLK